MVQAAPYALRFALAFFMVALGSVAVSAAEFRPKETPYSAHFAVQVIELTGDIVSGDTERLSALFDAKVSCRDCEPNSALVSLNSTGGNYKEGELLAHFFREHAIATIVESGRTCLSACAIAFLGGSGFWSTGGIGTFITRYIEPGARLGFHAPYLRPDDAQEIAKANLPLVLQAARLDNETLANIINTYYVDPYVIGSILVKGPDETYDIDTIEDMLKFRVNFPYFPPSFVSGTLAEKVRNVCLKLLSMWNTEPISDFEGDYIDKEIGADPENKRTGEKVFGYKLLDRPLNIDLCGFVGSDASHPLDDDVALFRFALGDKSQSVEDSFYTFTSGADGWSWAGYDNQMASRSFLTIESPLNYWMYDRKARISDVAKDFADYLKLQKLPPGVSVKDLQSAYIDRHNCERGCRSDIPIPSSDRQRTFFVDGTITEEQVWPRAMFNYLEAEAFAPRAEFTMTFSRKFPDAFVVSGKDAAENADIYLLGLRNAKGSATIRIKAPWDEGSRASNDIARKATSAIACSVQFGEAKLPCNR